MALLVYILFEIFVVLLVGLSVKNIKLRDNKEVIKQIGLIVRNLERKHKRR